MVRHMLAALKVRVVDLFFYKLYRVIVLYAHDPPYACSSESKKAVFKNCGGFIDALILPNGGSSESKGCYVVRGRPTLIMSV